MTKQRNTTRKTYRFERVDKYVSIWLILILATLSYSYAQTESDERSLLNVDDGIGFSKDSLFLLNLRFRMQNRAAFNTVGGDDLNIRSVEARIRRMRLRMDGFLLSPRLSYYIQLSFSKADQDLEEQNIPQPLRDGILYYTFNKNFYMGFGQSKLPANRERVISSGNLQFAERSIANAIFNIDRDFGLFGYYSGKMGNKAIINWKNVISSGEGRNASTIDNRLAYTTRIEVLPFGKFKNTGDYSMGDTDREPLPKLAVAATYHRNNGAVREYGTRGAFLQSPRDLQGIFADFIFKYQGFSTLVEYMSRQVDNPVIVDDGTRRQYVYTGQGWNAQSSYLMQNMWEVATRYTIVAPSAKISAFEATREVLGVGTTKYLNGHRVKLQSNIEYVVRSGNYSLANNGNRWGLIMQVEFGI